MNHKEQLERLEALRGKIYEQFAREADPENWPNTETRQGRGDRFWMKKNASATAELLNDLSSVIAKVRAESKESADEVISREARRLERVGAAVLERVGKKNAAPIDNDDDDDEADARH